MNCTALREVRDSRRMSGPTNAAGWERDHTREDRHRRPIDRDAKRAPRERGRALDDSDIRGHSQRTFAQEGGSHKEDIVKNAI